MPRARGQAPPFWGWHVTCPTRAGQAILEYALILAVVAAAVLGMQVYGKRGIQGVLKAAADDLSSVLPPSEDPREQGLLPEELAQLNGMRQEAGADARNRRGELEALPGTVVKRWSTFTTEEDITIRTGATAGGGFMTDNVAVSTVATGTSSASVLGEIQR